MNWDDYYHLGFTQDAEKAQQVVSIYGCEMRTINLEESFKMIDIFTEKVSYGHKPYQLEYNMKSGKVKVKAHEHLNYIDFNQIFTEPNYKMYLTVFAANDGDARKKGLELAVKATEEISDRYNPKAAVCFHKSFFEDKMKEHKHDI